ncbi:MAG TPA: 2Fe-2S iron-sulfur cluster-binding protein [Acidimicrobiia bacterium]
MAERLAFTCNDAPVELDVEPGESLLVVLRERLGYVSVKDGCAPQGQCGCCTVLVDGEPRVACVTPVMRVAGRAVTTVEGLDAPRRDALADAFVATGGSQCGFCTPGILVRVAALLDKGRTDRTSVDRALAAHLCRCTGWQTIHEAVALAAGTVTAPTETRDLDAASTRSTIEGGVAQRVAPDVPLGAGGFADDTAPRDALVAVPLPPGSGAEHVEAAGVRWVVGESLHDARTRAGKVQGRRTTVEDKPPLPLPEPWPDGVRLATSWVEPAYLEPDASWCEPGGKAATPLANGGAFGGKVRSVAPPAARDLADRFGRAVRVVLSREDVVRLGPKRPPIAARARWVEGGVELEGVVAAGGIDAFKIGAPPAPSPGPLRTSLRWSERTVTGPPIGREPRAAGLAEHAVLLAGALAAADVDPWAVVASDRDAGVMLDTIVRATTGALAGARVDIDPETARVERIAVKVAAGDVLDWVALRSYAIGAAHMGLGWVLSEGIAVDPDSGDVQDLTIRSFGILRARDMPPVDVEIVDDAGPPLAVSDAVYAAVAAATWNAVTVVEGTRPETFPARDTRVARVLRR